MSTARCEVVALCGDPSIAPVVARRVASAAQALWGDRVAVLHAASPRPSRIVDGVTHAWCEPTPEALRRACAAWGPRVARLVVVTPGASIAERIADRVVSLGAAPATGLCVELLPPDATAPPAWPGHGLAETVARGLLASRQPSAPRRTAAFPTSPLARIRLDPAWTADELPFARLPAPARESVARLARAITGRRVGAALGGAGAWGYTGVALLQMLAERGVPVDLVAGSSSGALAGAYHCVRGVEGLARLVARGPSFRRALPWMVASSAVAEWAVDADLGGARIESLETLFAPVVTSLARLRPEVVVAGTVGFGVRASVSAPGVFAAARADDHTPLVDGAAGDNAPAALVESLGADLTLVVNALPAPLPSAGCPSRMRQLATAFGVLLHRAGEREPSARRVIVSAAPASRPLRRTFRYDESARIAESARRDPRVVEAADALSRAWRELCRPHELPSPPSAHPESTP